MEDILKKILEANRELTLMTQRNHFYEQLEIVLKGLKIKLPVYSSNSFTVSGITYRLCCYNNEICKYEKGRADDAKVSDYVYIGIQAKAENGIWCSKIMHHEFYNECNKALDHRVKDIGSFLLEDFAEEIYELIKKEYFNFKKAIEKSC